MNLDKTLTISFNTYRELIRSKILYAVVLFALLILVVSSLFGVVTIGDKVKVLKDFGLFSLSIFSVLFVVITGSSLLYKELARKTIFNILSKPVTRTEFIFGKFLGITLTTILLTSIMAVVLISILFFYEKSFDPNLFWGFYGVILQIIIVSSLILLFSSILVTPMLSGSLVFIVFLIGRSSEFIQQLISRFEFTGLIKGFFDLTYSVIPHLDKLDQANQIVYGRPILIDAMLWNSVYALSYSIVAVVIAGYLFSFRQFN